MIRMSVMFDVWSIGIYDQKTIQTPIKLKNSNSGLAGSKCGYITNSHNPTGLLLNYLYRIDVRNIPRNVQERL